jgi:hypothetical protein
MIVTLIQHGKPTTPYLSRSGIENESARLVQYAKKALLTLENI